jgi:hypothetical protein
MAVKGQGQITIFDVSDGYSVTLTSEAYTFIGDTTGAPVGATCNTQATMFCGTEQCQKVTVGTIACPSGISASISNNGTATPTITFTTTAKITAACEATIPITADGVTINKKFSFAVAKTGATGTSVTISEKSVTYLASSSGTTVPSGNWSDSVPSTSAGQYLWTKTYVKYSDGTETTSYSVSRNGTNGTSGASAVNVTVTSDVGIMLKNNSGSAVLTAHVTVGTTECAISDAGAVTGAVTGTIKWYKGDPNTDSSLTAVATAKSLTVSAQDILNAQVYTCRLE